MNIYGYILYIIIYNITYVIHYLHVYIYSYMKNFFPRTIKTIIALVNKSRNEWDEFEMTLRSFETKCRPLVPTARRDAAPRHVAARSGAESRRAAGAVSQFAHGRHGVRTVRALTLLGVCTCRRDRKRGIREPCRLLPCTTSRHGLSTRMPNDCQS